MPEDDADEEDEHNRKQDQAGLEVSRKLHVSSPVFDEGA
jgi:hypothetical protein